MSLYLVVKVQVNKDFTVKFLKGKNELKQELFFGISLKRKFSCKVLLL